MIGDSLYIELDSDFIKILLKNGYIINESYTKIIYKNRVACLSWHKDGDINKNIHSYSFHKDSLTFITIKIC